MLNSKMYWFTFIGCFESSLFDNYIFFVYQACCALFEDGSWYRGLVVGIHSVHSIEVCTKLLNHFTMLAKRVSELA